jgi:hypothetical protein
VRDDEEAIEDTKGKRWHREEVHCRNRFTMIAQKRCPPLRWLGTPWRFPHPTQDRSFRNIEAQHLQLSMNAWRAPAWVHDNHPEDEFAQFFADAFSSRTFPIPREPCPIQLESRSMPPNDSLRLNDDQRLLPSRPELPQHHPERFVRRSKPQLRMFVFQNCELLPKGQVFQEQIAARAKTSSRVTDKEPHQAEHTSSFTLEQAKLGIWSICLI